MQYKKNPLVAMGSVPVQVKRAQMGIVNPNRREQNYYTLVITHSCGWPGSVPHEEEERVLHVTHERGRPVY